ncbi:MAG: DUF4251 domain-containing protein [Cyclobacteriaceae bacterium]|nr:DUF4251 domain-containing protein [Cyclobacteriaceae bacterium]
MRIVLCCIAMLMAYPACLIAQNQKISKKERKELELQQQIAQKKAMLDLLESQEWVLEAHTVFDRYNVSYQINPTINFVGIQGTNGVMQLGFDELIGWNGVGGVTIQGNVTKYELKAGKAKGNPVVTLRFQGRGMGAATLAISVNPTGQAMAKVNGDFGDRIIFSGIIKALSESAVYQGSSLF